MKPVPDKKADDDFFRFDVELTAKETCLIGNILAQWGALEHEIFNQTLLSFDDSGGDTVALPKEMNNFKFTEVLGHRKSRVVDKAKTKRARVLQKQYDHIVSLIEYRNALVHGMWSWSRKDSKNRISITRIRKKQIITTHFTVEDLVDFVDRLGSINFKIRFPRGATEYDLARIKEGSHISRRGACLFTGSPLDEGLVPPNPTIDSEVPRTVMDSQQDD